MLISNKHFCLSGFFILFLLIGANSAYSQKKGKVLCTPPTISASADMTICNGGTVTLVVNILSTTTPDYTYDWNPSASVVNSNTVTPALSYTTTASPSVTTTYTCIVTDNANCTSLPELVTITVNPTPTVAISGTNTICNGQSTTLTASGGVSYLWAPGGSTATSISVSPTTLTGYTVTGTDANSCTNSSTYSVSVNPTPTVAVSGNAVICNGSGTTLSATGASSYVWSPSGSLSNAGISNPVASPSVSTNYTVTGTDANSCTSTTTYSVTVNQTPTVTVTGNSTLCSGLSTTLTASGGASYVWSPGGATTTAISVTLTTSTNYTVTGTDANSCTDISTYSITVYPQPTANAGPDVSVCAGDNTTLNGSGNGTFLWSPATGLSCTTCSSPVSTPTAAITYTLTVTNVCGSATDDISVTYPALPSANAGSDVTICPGGNTTLTGTGSGTFVWSPSTGLSCVSCLNPVASPSISTSYSFSISGSCGTNTDDVLVTVASPTASITGNTTVCSGQTASLTASGGVSYIWNTGSSANPLLVNPTTATSYTVISTDGNGCTASDAITINPSPLPTANAGTDVSICSGSVTTLIATGNGTYLWTPSAGLNCSTCANPSAGPTVTTSYTLTVTNNCGTATDSITVSITLTPSVNAGADATICAGGNVSLNASGSGTYLWSPSSGLSNTTVANPVANPSVTTDYTVTITDVCGTASDVVTVNVNSLPVVSLSGNDTVCAGIADTLVATGGGAYLWNTGSTNDSIFVNPTVTSSYSVVVTGTNGCTASAGITVNASLVTAAISGTSATICAGQSSTLTASGGSTYLWNTGSSATSIFVSPTVASVYTVTATNALGCTDAATFSINVTAQPSASVTASSTTLCAGTSVSLSASGGSSYVWSPATGLNNTTISNPVSSSTASITYSVIVSTGACTDTSSISVTVNALPITTLTATQASICIGSCDSLFAAGGASYVWQPGGQTTSAINVCPTSAASYTVVATDANGCTDDASTLINVLPVVVANLSGDTVICNGDVSILTAQGGGLYSWNTGATTSSITVNPIAGTGYTVSVSNGACSDTAIIFINVNPLPTATATASPYTINIGAQVTLNGNTSTGSYNWSPATGLSCAVCSNPTANPTATTIYILTTVDSNGCVGSDTVIVNVLMECEEIFIPSAFSPNGDGYNDILYVRNACVLDMEFIVYNRWGQRVFISKNVKDGWDGNYNGKPADPAVFFYTLNVNFITGNSRYIDGNVTLIR